MASAAILHIGDDHRYRIPVMEHSGLFVVRSEPSIVAVEDALAKYETFKAITFHSDVRPPAEAVVSATRQLSTARLFLFQNPAVACDERVFDLVIPAQTPPDIWLKTLREAIEDARRLHGMSAQLRQESADVRAESQKHQAESRRVREAFKRFIDK